jgi:cytochrome P450
VARSPVSLAEEVTALFDHEPRVLADPYPLYRRLREEQPAYRHGHQVLVTRYRDVRRVLMAPSTRQGFSPKGGRYRDAQQRLPAAQRLQMVEMFAFLEKRLGGTDGEHHTRLRKLAQQAFTPSTVTRMRHRIEEITDSLLSSAAESDVIDFIDDVAYHVPLVVICEMLDISSQDREPIRRWGTDLGQFKGANWSDAAAVKQGHESVFNLRGYLYRLFEARRGGPTTDLLGALLSAEGDDGDRFTEDELVAMVTQIVFAGHETTTNLIGNACVLLLRDHRDQWGLLCDRPELVPNAVEEILRFESPAQYVDKLAAEDGEIAGTEVYAGDTVGVVLAAANRDPENCPEPETFDVTRENPRHVSFGSGPHHCLGAALARLEAATVLGTLTRRFPQMRLATDEVEWRRNHMFRGPVVLPVVLGPDRGANPE